MKKSKHKSDIKKNRKTNGRVKNLRVMPEPMENGTALDGVRKRVFLDRYSLKDESGNPLEDYPEQMWRRVAKGVAQTEKDGKRRVVWEKNF